MQRGGENFRIGTERSPLPIMHSLDIVKKAAARPKGKLGLIED